MGQLFLELEKPSAVMLNLDLDIQDDLSMSLETDPPLVIELMADSVQVLPEGTYDGPYQVTPTVDGFDVDVNDLFMKDDLTVNPIPVLSVPNASGGRTVTIG